MEKGFYGGKNGKGFLEAQKEGMLETKDVQADILQRKEEVLLLLKAVFLNELVCIWRGFLGWCKRNIRFAEIP